MVSWNHGNKVVYDVEIMCFDNKKYARGDPETLEQKEKILEGQKGEGNEEKEEHEAKEEIGREGDWFLTVKGRSEEGIPLY